MSLGGITRYNYDAVADKTSGLFIRFYAYCGDGFSASFVFWLASWKNSGCFR